LDKKSYDKKWNSVVLAAVIIALYLP